MAVHIRLTRVGATRRPAYRVIVIDSRRSRDGRALEILGFYDPLTNPVTIKLEDERIANWVARGARPSAAVQRLMKVAEAGPTLRKRPAAAEPASAEKPRRAPRTKRAAAEPAPEGAEPMAAAEVEAAEPAAEPAPELAEPPAEAEAEAAEPAPDGEPESATETTAEAEAEPVAAGTEEIAAGTATDDEQAKA